MTVEKVVENGMTYRVETTETSVVKMQMTPELHYDNVPESVTAGTVVTIPMRLVDFDGEARDDTRDLTFIVDGQPVELPLIDGNLSLELELAVRGRQRIALTTDTVFMKPIEIEVV